MLVFKPIKDQTKASEGVESDDSGGQFHNISCGKSCLHWYLGFCKFLFWKKKKQTAP